MEFPIIYLSGGDADKWQVRYRVTASVEQLLLSNINPYKKTI